jgi:hypothetical protein
MDPNEAPITELQKSNFKFTAFRGSISRMTEWTDQGCPLADLPQVRTAMANICVHASTVPIMQPILDKLLELNIEMAKDKPDIVKATLAWREFEKFCRS